MFGYCTISIIVSLLLFSSYNLYGLIHYKTIPIHLSESYYYFNNRKQGLGWLFPCLMWVMILLIVPVWLIINLKMQLPSMTYLICMVAAMIFCVGENKTGIPCAIPMLVQGIYFQRSVTEILVLFIYLIFYH